MARRRGEGSILKRHCRCQWCLKDGKRSCAKSCTHDNTWKAQWYCEGCDRHPESGKHSKSFRTESAARTHLRERLTAVDNGEMEPGKHTFNELIEVWLPYKKERTKRSTIVGYQSLLVNWILPRFGTTDVRKITTLDVDRFVDSIDRSPTTKRNAYRVLDAALKYAVKIGWVNANPCAAELPPDEDEKPGIVVTPDELEALCRAVEEPIYAAMIRLAGWTGLRSGELRALRVKHINPLKGEIHVQRSIRKIEGEWVETGTKTHEDRKLSVIKSALDPVIELMADKSSDDLLFTNGHDNIDGQNYISADQVLRRLRKATKVLPERKQAITVHGLRHTHASILIVYLEADVTAVQKRMGHKNASTTLDIYSHWFPEKDEELISAMEELATQAGAA